MWRGEERGEGRGQGAGGRGGEGNEGIVSSCWLSRLLWSAAHTHARAHHAHRMRRTHRTQLADPPSGLQPAAPLAAPAALPPPTGLVPADSGVPSLAELGYDPADATTTIAGKQHSLGLSPNVLNPNHLARGERSRLMLNRAGRLSGGEKEAFRRMGLFFADRRRTALFEKPSTDPQVCAPAARAAVQHRSTWPVSGW